MAEVRSEAVAVRPHVIRFPLYARIAVAVAGGVLLGMFFGKAPYWPGGGFGNVELGRLTLLVVTLLKALASPLIFFAVLDAFLRTEITFERGGKLILFSLVNVVAAMTIGLAVMNLWRPGESWQGKFEEYAQIASSEGGAKLKEAAPLTVVESLRQAIPENLFQPFINGNLLGVILLAVLSGAALRVVRGAQQRHGQVAYLAVEQAVETLYQVFVKMLEWVVLLVPLAVLGGVAQSVAETGSKTFPLVGIFLLAMLTGLAIHAFGYYVLAAWLYGGKSPPAFLRAGFEPFLTGLSTNSSLVTIPVTLRALTERLGVSEQSARLSTCVGTNFNNDGITLYEAMAAIFVAQAVGLNQSLGVQINAVVVCVLASLGSAGIPQAGLVILPLVLAATGLSDETINIAWPLIMAVDWIIARVRSGVNVLGDMTVAVQLDRSRHEGGG
ncbi:MAG: dicarboxylate/amino acid:cation symporter [Planctomycetia bacterium]|nr:dicarboxylate/amino acid:cation symporter [Planctomycetia bacterium]